MIGLGQVGTDAAGEFYWGRLEPGTYVIAVEAHPWYAQNYRPPPGSNNNGAQANASPDLDVAYPVIYSGGATDPDSATPISIAAGNPGEYSNNAPSRSGTAYQIRFTRRKLQSA